MTDNTVSVEYVAKASFGDLIRQAVAARAAVKALNDEAARSDRTTAARSAESTAARLKEARATGTSTAAARAAFNAEKIAAAGRRASARAADDLTAAQGRSTRAAKDGAAAARTLGRESETAGARAAAMGKAVEGAFRRFLKVKDSESVASASLNRLQSGFTKLGNTKVNLGPLSGSLLAIVPAIGGVLSLVNPLVAGLGAIAAAGIGMASSLGTAAGAVVGLVPALAAALSVAGALRLALGGVGGAISAGIKDATKPSTAPKAAKARSGRARAATPAKATVQDPYGLSSTEKITRAQEAYARSIQDVHFAEQNLFDARKSYTRQVQDLTEAIEQYTDATKAADAASVESAKENYDNVLASSLSTKAQKDAARAAIAQAQEQQENDATQNARNVADLAELRAGGINNNQAVVDAARGITDAKNARRDAQLALKNARYDAAHPVRTGAAATTGAGAGVGAGATAAVAAADPYAAALSKLSPSAQKFVRWVVGMRGAWEDLRKAVQEAFFDKFVGDLDRLKGLLPPVRSMLVDIAGALGKIADNVLRQVTSPDWKHDIVLFGTEMAPILLTAGKGLQALLQAFKDLTMASMPFLKDMVTWLSKGAEKFAAFIKHGRDTGTIAGYLDGVFTVLKKWWTVIKNVATTLLNYGTASSSFGQWLTDGLVKLTGAWKTASEGALATNSPFKRWLENTKPVLRELKRDIGAFFTWVADTASNTTNLGAITDVLKALRTKIGPDIGKVLKALADAKVPQAFIRVVGDLTDLIATIMENGGAQGVRNFFDSLDWILGVLIAAARSPIGKFITTTFLPLIGTLAAFVMPFGPVSLFMKLLSVLTDFRPGSALSKVGGWLGDMASAVGRFVGPAIAGAASVLGDILGFLAAPIVLPKWLLPEGPNNPAPIAAMKPLPLKFDLTTAGKALALFAGGIPGLIAKNAGDAFRKVGGPGAWIAIQEKKIAGWATALYKKISGAAGDVFRTVVGPGSWIAIQAKKISDWATALYKKISAAAGDPFRTLQSVADWIAKQAKKISDWAAALYKKVSAAAGDPFRWVVGVGGWLSAQATAIGKWASGIPAAIGRALAGMWGHLPNLRSWLDGQLRGLGALGTWAANALGLNTGGKKPSFSGGGGSFGGGSAGGKWAGTISKALSMAHAPQSWASDIATIIQHESSGNPRAENKTDTNWLEGNPSIGLMQLTISNFQRYAGSLRSRGQTDALANIYAGIKYIQDRYGTVSKVPGIKSLRKGGGYLPYASGGLVPGQGNTDSVPSMLMPGEFVLTKRIVNAIGLDNLNAVNSGLMNFGQVLAGLQRPAYATNGHLAQNAPTLPVKAPLVASSSPFIGRDLVVHVTPRDEPLAVSLPRTVRNLSYLHSGR